MTSIEAIKNEFIKEYIRMDFSKITVKGLCSSTPVARTTFYSYFENTDDVRCAIEDDIISGLKGVMEDISKGDLPGMDFNVYMDAIESYIKNNCKVRTFL